jgi:hypothetical protein
MKVVPSHKSNLASRVACDWQGASTTSEAEVNITGIAGVTVNVALQVFVPSQ